VGQSKELLAQALERSASRRSTAGRGAQSQHGFRGQTRTNATHESTTEPEARLYKKAPGQPAELSYLGHVLMENRNGLAVQATVTPATGTAAAGRGLGDGDDVAGQWTQDPGV
jgi:hypothetical protein